MSTGAIFGRGSCGALRWLVLLGVVFALGAGEALAQTYSLSASSSMTEGQSLVPVSVRLTAPAEVGRNKNVTITVSVTQLTDPEILSWQGVSLAVLESMQPPVTRAELNEGKVWEKAEDVVKLTSESDVQWMADVIGDVKPNNSDGTAAFTFDYGEDVIDITHTAYLRTNRDSADAEDELFRLETKASPVISATGADSVNVKIDDVQTQTYAVNFPGDNDMTIDEGMDAGLELEAVPDRTVKIPFNVTLSSKYDVTDYSLDENPAAFSQNYDLGVKMAQGFTVKTKAVDGDRVDDTVTVTVQTTNQPGTQRTLETFDLKVIDLHKLPKITLTKIQVPDADDKLQTAASIPEGKVGTITLTADRSPRDVPASEDITVTLSHGDGSTADTRDYTLNGSTVTFSGSDTTEMFEVDVDADEDVREESLVLEAMVEGTTANGPNPSEKDPHETLAAIPFSDQTAKQIEAMSQAEVYKARDDAKKTGAGANGLWEPGETLTLKADQLFKYAATSSVVLGNIVVDAPAILSAAASNDMVTITALGDGKSAISITGTVVGTSSLEVTQTVSNVATIKFEIMVDTPMIVAKDNEQAVADAAVLKAASDSANGIWESAPNGAAAMIALSDLFDVPASIEPRYLAESSTGNVDADVNSSTMMLELEPEAAGMAVITVTAVDTDRPGNAVSVDFNVEVMEQASLRAMSQDEVDKVFMEAGAGALVAGGDAIMVDMSMLYEIADGVTPTYTATSDMPDVLAASTSGMMLTLTPMSDGNAMIMVEAVDSASQSIVPVMYDATVGAAAITYMLSGPMDMNIAEGSSAMLTATASSAVPMDTEVMIMRDGASTAGMDDYEVAGMIMINAGATTGTTMVMATEDNMAEDMEMLTLYGMVGDMQLNSVTFNIWDAAVPALPVIAQLLLAAFLAIGGYRRYLRR